MQTKAVVVAAVLGAAALGWSALPANAAECFRETVTGPGGTHEVMRGCVVRERVVPRVPRRTVTTTRTITRDYYVTEPAYRTTVTRYYYTVPRDEETYYGASFAPSPYYYDWGY